MAHHDDLESGPDKFLLQEYTSLLELGEARNERFDRLVTMFLSLAGAPWVLYAIIIKDKGGFVLAEMPPLIALVFLIVGLLGFLVVMMCVQTKFLVTLYTRTVNAIRGHFADKKISIALHLPTSGDVPPYYEKGSYNFYAALGMACVNGIYVWLACYRLLGYWLVWQWRAAAAGIIIGTLWVLCHYWYYVGEARSRETRGKHGLTRNSWSKSSR